MSRPRILAVAAFLAACGGPGGGAAGPTMTFSAAGLSPRSAEVMAGTCVQLHNADTVAHDVAGDDAAACPDLAQPRTIAPGATSTVCFMMAPATCAFHAAARGASASGVGAAFAGTIQVDDIMMGGGMMTGGG